MENRIGSSHEAEIPKKSRSLDLKSLYQSEGSKEVQTKNLKRKGGIDVSAVDKKHERKKSRKAVSVSSFRKVNGNGSKSLEEVYNGSLSSGSHDSKDSKDVLNQRSNHGSGFSSMSQTLEGSFIKIPRRKRGFVGRRKVENVIQLSKTAVLCSGEVGNGDQVVKLTGKDTGKQVKPLKVKQKKVSDEFKENGNAETNSGKDLEQEAERPDRLVVNSGDLSMEKSHTGQFVENNGDSSSKKSLRKRSRKSKGLVPDGKSVAKEAQPSIDSDKVSDDLPDDEENLEENAARMLSSRFDPSCTGFSLNSKVSSLPSANGLSFLLSSGQEFTAHGSNDVSGSESASVDTAGRVLRPRKQHKEKGNSRKRRHYYEIFTGDLDAYWVLNRRIKVFWPLDQSWYYGLISDYDTVKKLHHVKYDDRDEEWINLQDERFKLLLLPSEVPGKRQRKRSAARVERSNGENGKLKRRKEKKRDLATEDDNYMGNYMDSEPIISWLARSSQRVKSSPFHASKKQKVSTLSLTSRPPSLTDDGVSRHEHLDGGSQNKDTSNLSGNSGFLGRFAAGGRIEVSPLENTFHPKDNKLPLVYYRRRFRNSYSVPCHSFEANHVPTSLPESDISLGPVGVSSGPLEKQHISLERLDPDEALEKLDTVEALWLTDVTGLLKLNVQLMESRRFRFELSFPVLSTCNYSFGTYHPWFFHAILLLQYGTLMTMWPRVHLEMLFVDNMVGLRFLLFEGCLKQAIAFVFQVLAVFHPPTEHRKFADLQLPVTSIKFKFSCIDDFRKQLVFAFYNFVEVKISKWMDLDSKLKKHCLLTEQLPLSECTYDNVRALQNGTSQLLSSSVCNVSSRIKGRIRRSRQCMSLVGVSRESTCINASPSSSSSDKSHRWFPPFALSFTAAPTFFLGLHLKLLMEHSVTRLSFHDHVSMEHPENSGSFLADDCSSGEDCSNKDSESTPENNCKASSRDIDYNEFISCSKTVPQAVDISVTSVGDWMKPSLKHHNSDVNVENSAIFKDPGKLGNDAVGSPQKLQFHHSESERCHLSPKPPVDRDKSGTGSHSLLNGITVEIPSFSQFDKHVDKELHGAQPSTDLSWNMNGGVIPSPNPTARRSTWHRNRNSSTSFGYLAHGWADGRVDFLQNNFGNGPKKPRTQVSYALPFGGFDYSSKNKGHLQKGFPQKRIRTANEKRSSDVSRGSERNLELLSCEANVLITLGDRGWRECGAHVVLELFDHNEWKLAVKISGITKYSYKAHQFLQPGSTNRFTHAMMWKGGKDWILEFPDRSQWALFKEMHEECYNRNIRAASVKNIPIPGVRLIEENDDNGIEVPFVRSSSKYFRQIETDIEMALDPLRVLYDMDSDDEQWMSKHRTFSEVSNSTWEISEDMFEKIVDMFEKAAYSQQCDQFTSDEIEDLMAGLGPMEVIKIIHEYWQQKRQRKGMPLIRHLQPPLWERYQHQVREWELAKSNMTLASHEKVAHVEKPPMFAFCLKPRGLEVPNKGSKHRSQRKISVTGQSNIFSGDHDGFHAYGRRLNGFAAGDEKAIYQGHNYEPFDDSPVPQISPRVFSPRDAGGKGYFSMSADRYERNHVQKLYRSKSKKPGAFMFPNDTQMVASYHQRMFDKRNRAHRWNIGYSEWPNQRYYHIDGPICHGSEHFDSSDLDEFRLRDASGAAKHALNMAKLKREKAQRLLYRADLAIHKAVVALMTAEAIKASSEDLNGDG